MAIGVSVDKSNGGGSSNISYFHGLVRVGDEKFLITFLDGKNEHEDVRGKKEDLPTNVQKNLPKGAQFDAAVIFDDDNDAVIALNPWEGKFVGVGQDIGPRVDGADSPPMYKIETKPGKDGKPYDDKSFWESFEILSAVFSEGNVFVGSKPRAYLKYKFHVRNDGFVDISGTDASKHTKKLKNAIIYQGLGDEDIVPPEDGNILPELLDRVQENKRKVYIHFSDGFLNDFSPIREYDANVDVDNENPFGDPDVDDVEVEKAFPVVKTSKEPAQKNLSQKKPVKKVSKAEDDPDDL